ncbi:hypothetical protein V6N13_132490 [Hibiscus sabdariffa]
MSGFLSDFSEYWAVDLWPPPAPREVLYFLTVVLGSNGTVSFHSISLRSLGANDPSIGRRTLGAENYLNSKLVFFHGLKDASNSVFLLDSLMVKDIQLAQICKEVAVALLLLNATLVLPEFLYSNVWKDPSSSKYLALHLRFEEDMAACFLCHFGGGEYEKKELEAHREEFRKLDRCPLTPEEAALVPAALDFKRGTYIHLAGSHMAEVPTCILLPLAALDFIARATSDVFAMADSGSQLSLVVSG